MTNPEEALSPRMAAIWAQIEDKVDDLPAVAEVLNRELTREERSLLARELLAEG